ncbi:MAG: 2-amino-4-hydroxy-6-hydroxymethyldihydropteridine diphosphokinase [Roseinatronobacter sp.]|jgi:2-amino-4-hydroxy-6-hydroxymethyldihydropteridine diphosphokinase|nr:2-amino-4-hydroxy-6-hydroxymethyldihydropteridine diphosphokinase [Roseinatronobacter sp.]
MTVKQQPMICNQVLIALGGNVTGQKDSPFEEITDAITQISLSELIVVKQSRAYRTPCFPAGADPDFVNAALLCKSTQSPAAILQILHQIEARAGRERKKRWGPRVIDLDLLAMGDLILPDRTSYLRWAGLPLAAQMQDAPDDLILPHPRLHERAFVLAPLMDIAPEWCHPVLNMTVAEMFAALDPALLADIHPISP